VSVEIIQDIIPRSLCLAAEASWPSRDWPYWHRYNGKTANKYGTMDRSRIPPACLAALDALALAAVLRGAAAARLSEGRRRGGASVGARGGAR
jgi:hypothetical protein